MKSLYAALVTVGFTAALSACGGSGDGNNDRQVLVTPAPASIIGDDADGASDGFSFSDGRDSQVGVDSDGSTSFTNNDSGSVSAQSLLLQGAPISESKSDLVISNVASEDGGDTITYQFTVSDIAGAAVALENLSVALEVSATGSFSDSYSIPLFDIRESGDNNSADSLKLSARSTGTQLPTGDYISRLVVNPNWQQAFDIVPAGKDAVPFHYVEERNYSNNASGSFQISVAGSHTCSEDGYEDDDGVSSATPIPAGEQISASLCLDDADYYSVVLSAGDSTSLTFDYTDTENNPNAATRYVVLDSSFNRVTEPTVARESNRIVIKADRAGQYYLVLFGDRSSYRITRVGGPGLLDDVNNENLFHSDTAIGPHSWLYGGIILNRLALSEALLVEQTVNCGRITTQYSDNRPVAYVTPSHFAGLHEFRFLADGGYLVDGEATRSWRVVDGDISHANWYSNGYPGYAEKVSNNEWRYWTRDGLAYVECTLQVNR